MKRFCREEAQESQRRRLIVVPHGGGRVRLARRSDWRVCPYADCGYGWWARPELEKAQPRRRCPGCSRVLVRKRKNFLTQRREGAKTQGE
jgi:hypothetical protein